MKFDKGVKFFVCCNVFQQNFYFFQQGLNIGVFQDVSNYVIMIIVGQFCFMLYWFGLDERVEYDIEVFIYMKIVENFRNR